MKDINYITLHHKKISDQASQTELDQLESWIRLSPDNQEDIDHLDTLWDLSLDYVPEVEFDSSKGLNTFKNKIASHPDSKIIKLKPKYSGILKIAASLTVLAVAGFLILNMLSPNKLINFGTEISMISLEDGSQLWLSPNSVIEYDRNFSKNHRTMAFEGKAFFDVTKNEDLPFIVNMGAQSIEVLGTSFNLTHRNDNVILEVLTGVVKFRDSQDRQNTAKAGQSIVFNATLNTASLSEIKSTNAFSWKERSLSFNSTPLEQVFKDLENYYEINIDDNDINIADCTFSSPKLDNASLDQTLEILNKVAGVEFTGDASKGKLVLTTVDCLK